MRGQKYSELSEPIIIEILLKLNCIFSAINEDYKRPTNLQELSELK